MLEGLQIFQNAKTAVLIIDLVSFTISKIFFNHNHPNVIFTFFFKMFSNYLTFSR